MLDNLDENTKNQTIGLYLQSIQAPFFIYVDDKEMLELNSPRTLLLIIGWLITIDNHFDKIDDKIMKTASKIDFTPKNFENTQIDKQLDQQFQESVKAKTSIKTERLFEDSREEVIYYRNLIEAKKNHIKK